ncbi:MAG: tetratricopeptide repeat protein [Ignavibacteriales bacterium]|nr:tetratricopeptide repeat protein [Ignavibacteriales bacterium]
MFAIITIAVAIALLIALDIALRLFNYGRDLELVITSTRNGKQYYSINPTVGKRYFDPKRYALPKVEDGYFMLQKPANAFRIFCLGASTTAGFPYEYNATPSRMLQKRLELAFPEKIIEVVNVGLTATNSYTVVEFARELVPYQPDAFVVYTGQNEFYGALGVGSTVSAGHSSTIVRLYLALRRVKTFVLFEELLTGVSRWFLPEPAHQDGTLMQQMAADKAIPIGGSLYQSACETYRQNLLDLAAITAEKHIPLILSTLVANERGLPPFVSTCLTNTGEKDREEVERLVNESITDMPAIGAARAKAALLSALKVDSTYARTWYGLGQCYDSLGRYDSAAIAYSRARDCDGLRFRAPSEFNAIVRQVASNPAIILADVDSAFRTHSPYAIIGNELLWEHVHPRHYGYILLSQVWFQSLMKMTNESQSGRNDAAPSDSAFYRSPKMTYLDEAFGRYKMERLMNRWPFVRAGNGVQQISSNDTTRIVILFLDGTLRWNEAHYEMADVYLKRRDFSSAAKEYEAVSEFYREDPFPLVRGGDMYAVLGQFEKAAEAYERAIAISDNQFLQLRLGVALVTMKKPERALSHLTRSVELDAQAPKKFSRLQKTEAAYYYATALSQLGRKAEAKAVLSMILAQNPGDQRVQKLLRETDRH